MRIVQEHRVAHGGIQHSGNKAALDNVYRMAKVFPDIKFESAGAFLSIDIDQFPAHHTDELRAMLIALCYYLFFAFHKYIPRRSFLTTLHCLE